MIGGVSHVGVHDGECGRPCAPPLAASRTLFLHAQDSEEGVAGPHIDSSIDAGLVQRAVEELVDGDTVGHPVCVWPLLVFNGCV